MTNRAGRKGERPSDVLKRKRNSSVGINTGEIKTQWRGSKEAARKIGFPSFEKSIL